MYNIIYYSSMKIRRKYKRWCFYLLNYQLIDNIVIKEMDNIKIIELKESIFEDNDKDAFELNQELTKNKTFLVNVMSSPGSGKTTLLKALLTLLKDKYKFGVMEADIDGDVDAYEIAKVGVKSIQLHTGGMCHLDADMTRQGLKEIDYQDFDCVFLENIGNLVCPVEFKTGSHLDLVILSIPEGDDKPVKYPLMFESVDLVIINKIDTIEYFDFDIPKCMEYVKKINPKCVFLSVSAVTGEGMDSLKEYFDKKLEKFIYGK